jgi:NAD+ diphosphatase
MISAGFTGSTLNRADHLRADKAAFEDVLNDWRAVALTLDGLDPAMSAEGALIWKPLADVSMEAELLLLGLDGDKPHFVELSKGQGGTSRTPAVWRALSTLPADQAAIYGTARSLIDWHNNHSFCSRCGGTTKVFRAGWGRLCQNCNAEHYPRTDPVVIMLAEYEGKVLVGRQSKFPAGNYSALAGFLEPGESIEEAVARELFEEAGVVVSNVRYVTSQPWPFGGSQLMIACTSDAQSDALTLDTNEIEDAMWVTRDEVRAALNGDEGRRFTAPPPFAIAHSLLKHWVS